MVRTLRVRRGQVAQSVERRSEKPEVDGSTPSLTTTETPALQGFRRLQGHQHKLKRPGFHETRGDSAHSNDPHGHRGLTPNERAELLQGNVTFFHAMSPPDFQEFLEDFFGEDLEVSVGEKNKWTKAVCAGEVPFPEE